MFLSVVLSLKDEFQRLCCPVFERLNFIVFKHKWIFSFLIKKCVSTKKHAQTIEMWKKAVVFTAEQFFLNPL